MKRSVWICILGVVFGSLSASRAALVNNIDIFEDGDQEVAFPLVPGDPGLGSTTSMISSSSIMGGVRRLDFGVTRNTFSAFGTGSTAVVETARGEFSVNNDAGVVSSAMLIYDADGAGLGGIDLTDGGANGISIDLVSLDLSVTISVGITDTSGRYAELTRNDLVAIGGSNVFEFAYADFEGDSVDFENSDALELILDVGDGSDVVVQLLGTTIVIPEPSSAVLIIGAASFLCAGQRRKRRSL